MKTAPGFKKFSGEHCTTTALRQVFSCEGMKLSEEMLLGLGEGIGFEYRIDKKAGTPVLNMRGAGLLELESNVCRRLGIKMKVVKLRSRKSAQDELFKILEQGSAALVYVDVGALPYAEKGSVCHVGAHAVAVAGFDTGEGNCLVADADEPFHRVEFSALAAARDAAECPSLHDNTLLKLSYPKTLSPIASAIESAAESAARRMLASGDSGSGVRGMRSFAEDMKSWQDRLGEKRTVEVLKRLAVLIEGAGTGGGGFRKIYGRFLGEASRMLKDPQVSSLAVAVTGIARKWSTVAGKMDEAKVKDVGAELAPMSRKISEIADSEEEAWQRQKTIFE